MEVSPKNATTIDQFYQIFDDTEIHMNFKELNVYCKDYLFLSSHIIKWIKEEFNVEQHNPKHKEKDQKKIISYLSIGDIYKELYDNGCYLYLLKSRDPELLSMLFKQEHLFSPGIVKRYSSELLPLSLLVDAMKLIAGKIKINLEQATSCFFELTHFIIRKSYFPSADRKVLTRKDVELDFNTRDDLILEKRFDIEFIRQVIQVVLCDDINRETQLPTVSDILFYLCLLTFQNLNEKDIQELKDDYILLLPYIFKYFDISQVKKEGDHGNLFYFYKYYGRDRIEKKSMKFYQEWRGKKNPNLVNNIIKLLYCVGDSNLVRENIHDFYTILIDAYSIDNQRLHNDISNCISMLIKRYGIELDSSNLTRLYSILLTERSIFDKRSYKGKSPELYDLFVVLLSSHIKFAISKFDELLEIFLNTEVNNIIFLNKLLIQPSMKTALQKSLKFNEYFKTILAIAEKSSERYIYLLDYCMLHQDDKLLKSRAKLISKAINSNSKWVIKDNDFYRSLLEYYQRISSTDTDKIEHFEIFEKTIRSFLKTGHPKKLVLEIIFTHTNKPKEIDYLFKQIKELLTEPQTCANILREFLEKEKGREYVLKYFDSRPIDLTGKKHRENLMILGSLYRFMDLDEKVKSNLLQHLLHLSNFQELNCYYPSDLISSTKNATRSIIHLFRSLIDFKEFYLTFVDTLFDSSLLDIKPKFRRFNEIHQLLFNSDNHNSYYNDDLKEINSYILESFYSRQSWKENQDLEIIQKILFYFKAFGPQDKLNDELITNTINLFKSYGSQLKRYILNFIKRMGIESLEFLYDSKLTGFSFNQHIQEEDFSLTPSYVQNLIIQNILSFIFGDKCVANKEYLNLALVSKSFFLECKKIFKNSTIKFSEPLKDTTMINYQSEFSLFNLGAYHLNSSQFHNFSYSTIESLFYQLKSVTMNTPFNYKVTCEEMINLRVLRVEIYHQPIFPAIEYLLSRCKSLIEFDFSVNFIENSKSKLIISFLEILLKNNHSLELVKFRFSIGYGKEFPAFLKPILKILRKHEKSNPTSFRFLTFISHPTRPRFQTYTICGGPNFGSGDMIPKYFYKNCYELGISYSPIQIDFSAPGQFPRLRKITVGELAPLSPSLKSFIVSNFLLKLETVKFFIQPPGFFELIPMLTQVRKLVISFLTKKCDFNVLFSLLDDHKTIKELKIVHNHKNILTEDSNDYGFEVSLTTDFKFIGTRYVSTFYCYQSYFIKNN